MWWTSYRGFPSLGKDSRETLIELSDPHSLLAVRQVSGTQGNS